MGCGGSGEDRPEKPEKRYEIEDLQPGAQKGERVSEVPGEVPGEPEVKEETPTPLPPAPIERDPKHIFSIKFKKKPLSIVITSDRNGTSAYVTEVNGKKNRAVKKNKLPLKSKLLKVNDIPVEWGKIANITQVLIQSLEKLPVELTFCHPDGLTADEIADPSPGEEFTK